MQEDRRNALEKMGISVQSSGIKVSTFSRNWLLTANFPAFPDTYRHMLVLTIWSRKRGGFTALLTFSGRRKPGYI
jgi:hypothetical protein